MESFFATLKLNRAHPRGYKVRGKARADLFYYIERHYNPGRKHSTSDYLGREESEQQFASHEKVSRKACETH